MFQVEISLSPQAIRNDNQQLQTSLKVRHSAAKQGIYSKFTYWTTVFFCKNILTMKETEMQNVAFK